MTLVPGSEGPGRSGAGTDSGELSVFLAHITFTLTEHQRDSRTALLARDELEKRQETSQWIEQDGCR